MIVSIMSSQAIQRGHGDDDLMTFGVDCVNKLIPKVSPSDLGLGVIQKVLSLYLHVKNIKIREMLSKGLLQAFGS